MYNNREVVTPLLRLCKSVTYRVGKLAAIAMMTAIFAVLLWSGDQVPITSAAEPLQAASAVPVPDMDESLPVSVRVTALDGLMEGDSTVDGITNIIDAMFIAQYTVGLRQLDQWQFKCADTDDNGVVNIVDAMHIAQYTVDPSGSGGVLFKDLWEADSDGDMLPPG